MKTRTILALLVVLGIVGSLAYWSSRNREKTAAPHPSTGKRIFPGLAEKGVSAVELTRADGVIAVSWFSNAWIVPSKYGYPADPEKIGRFLDDVAGLQAGQMVTATGADLAKLSLIPPGAGGTANAAEGTGTKVELRGDDGKPAASFIVGRSFDAAAREDEAPWFDRMPSSRYVKAGDDVFLVRDSLRTLPSKAMEWISTDLFDSRMGDIERVIIKGEGRETTVLARRPGFPGLVPENMATNQKPDDDKIQRITSAFGGLSFEDIADPSLPDETTGMNNPVECTAITRDARALKIRIGKPRDSASQRYARVSMEFTPAPPPPAGDAASTNAAAEAARLARAALNEKIVSEAGAFNNRHGRWTYMLNDYNANPLIETSAGLVETLEPATNVVPAAVIGPEEVEED